MEKISAKNLLISEMGTSEKLDISASINDFDFPEDIKAKDVHGKLKLIKLEETILVQGDFESEVEVTCDRCLETFKKKITFSIDREFEINRLRENEEEQFVDKYGNIDISEPVREELIMAIPMRNICKDECKGICTDCGINLNKENCKCK